MRTPIVLRDQMPFSYAVSFSIPLGGQTSATLVMDNDSEFDLYAIVAATSDDEAPASGLIPNNFSLFMRNTTNGRSFMNESIQRGCLAGQLFTFALGEGKCIRFEKKAELSFTFTDIRGSGSGPLLGQLTLKGYKVYNPNPSI